MCSALPPPGDSYRHAGARRPPRKPAGICTRARFGSISGVRLANAMHLSSWTGHEVPLDFDEDLYLSELNKRIREEGKFPERT
jgi:hypothetical protein